VVEYDGSKFVVQMRLLIRQSPFSALLPSAPRFELVTKAEIQLKRYVVGVIQTLVGRRSGCRYRKLEAAELGEPCHMLDCSGYRCQDGKGGRPTPVKSHVTWSVFGPQERRRVFMSR